MIVRPIRVSFNRLSKLIAIAALSAFSNAALVTTYAADAPSQTDAVLLGRGINLGNALEAPHEGDWGVRLKEEYFERIAAAGFDSVRIPVRWSAHAAEAPPYTIDEKFIERVDWTVDQALKRKLSVVLNMHHYDGMMDDPAKH